MLLRFIVSDHDIYFMLEWLYMVEKILEAYGVLFSDITLIYSFLKYWKWYRVYFLHKYMILFISDLLLKPCQYRCQFYGISWYHSLICVYRYVMVAVTPVTPCVVVGDVVCYISPCICYRFVMVAVTPVTPCVVVGDVVCYISPCICYRFVMVAVTPVTPCVVVGDVVCYISPCICYRFVMVAVTPVTPCVVVGDVVCYISPCICYRFVMVAVTPVTPCVVVGDVVCYISPCICYRFVMVAVIPVMQCAVVGDVVCVVRRAAATREPCGRPRMRWTTPGKLRIYSHWRRDRLQISTVRYVMC